jgi:hypothetical protein
MDYRLSRISAAAFRIVRRKAGDRLDEGLRRLIEDWAAGRIDPLSDKTPMQLSTAHAGRASAAALTPDERRVKAMKAAAARWNRGPSGTRT